MQPLSFLELPNTTADKSVGGSLRKSDFTPRSAWRGGTFRFAALHLIALACLVVPTWLYAHGVASGDASFLENQSGFQFWPYFYLGAKHMVTGYDHLLFLAGVIFFLYRIRDIGIYVTLFAIGHSITLVAGAWLDIPANVYLIDAIIGVSVVYKAFDNLGGFAALGVHINTKVAVWVFGLFHGLGLATKLQALSLSEEGLLGNLIAFNLGVEAGQILALTAIFFLMALWRRTSGFRAQAMVANVAIMACGFVLVGYQLTGYFN